MTDKRLVVTGIVALVFTVPVLVGGRRCVKAICIGAAKAESTGAVNLLTDTLSLHDALPIC